MVSREPDFFSSLSALHGAFHHGVQKHFLRRFGVGERAVGVHHAGEKLFIDAAAVNANPNRLIVAAGRFHHHRKIVAVVFSLTDVTGVDAVLGKGLGTLRDFG